MTYRPHPTLLAQVLPVLDQVLGLRGRSSTFGAHTALLGAVPELDSMAVISLVAALEDRFGLDIADEDLEAATFATVGSVCALVARKQTP